MSPHRSEPRAPHPSVALIMLSIPMNAVSEFLTLLSEAAERGEYDYLKPCPIDQATEVAVIAAPTLLDGLTKQEAIALHHVIDGMSNLRIAQEMHLSIHTVKGYMSSILEKLDVDCRTAAATKAQNLGFDDQYPKAP